MRNGARSFAERWSRFPWITISCARFVFWPSHCRRRVAVALVASGRATVAEAAKLAGCSRQRLHDACRRRRMWPVSERRADHLKRLWSRVLATHDRQEARWRAEQAKADAEWEADLAALDEVDEAAAPAGRYPPHQLGAVRRGGTDFGRRDDRRGDTRPPLFGRARRRAAGRAEGLRPLRSHPGRGDRGRTARLTAPRAAYLARVWARLVAAHDRDVNAPPRRLTVVRYQPWRVGTVGLAQEAQERCRYRNRIVKTSDPISETAARRSFYMCTCCSA